MTGFRKIKKEDTTGSISTFTLPPTLDSNILLWPNNSRGVDEREVEYLKKGEKRTINKTNIKSFKI